LNLTMLGGPATPGVGLASLADLSPRALALAYFLAGAVAGGLLLRIDPWVPLAVAVMISVVVGIALSRQRAVLVPSGR
jgi:hypothetical protein